MVLILCDDLGYGDVGCFGAKDIRTPNIDRLAAEGTRFTSFYVGQPVCTASRAGLMTGCYPNRIGLFGALNHESNVGIASNEFLLPEMLKLRGYATAIYGKWHLGHRDRFLPTRHGFDEFFGIPYSNDNGPLHGSQTGLPPLPLLENEKIVEHDPDQSQFTRLLTERAASFIDRNHQRLFFLYLPHVMPHVPISASENFKGRSRRHLYGDVVEELDWSSGKSCSARAAGLERPHARDFRQRQRAISLLRQPRRLGRPAARGQIDDLGRRRPRAVCLRLPGVIPAGRQCDEPISTIDLLPTLAALVGARCRRTRSTAATCGQSFGANRGLNSPARLFTITPAISCRPCAGRLETSSAARLSHLGQSARPRRPPGQLCEHAARGDVGLWIAWHRQPPRIRRAPSAAGAL